MIGPHDLMIAGNRAGKMGLTLITNNLREFERIPNLICEDWTVLTIPSAGYNLR
jgi:tRNA(fMet)-specific endonuclease VapC